MESVTISVIVPCYNAINTIDKCVTSLLESKGVSLQIILADDGSTDGSSEICGDFANKHKNVIHLALPHNGVASARNAALKVSSGDYIGFVDSDDWVEPDMFRKLLKPLSEGTGLISVCGFIREGKDYRDIISYDKSFSVSISEFRQNLFSDERTEGFLFNKLFPASLMKNVFFDHSLTHCEDLCFIFSLSIPNNARIVYCPEALYHYVQSESSLTGGRSFFREGVFVYAPAFRLCERSASDKDLIRIIRAKYCKILRNSISVTMKTGTSHPVHTSKDMKELRLLRSELRKALVHLSIKSLPIRQWLSWCKYAYYPLTALLASSDSRLRKHTVS